jgi:YD repeat-containing protein
MRSLLVLAPALALTTPAVADTKVATGSTPARIVPQVCPLAADITRPWTHDVFPGCAPYAYGVTFALDARPCEVEVAASRRETIHHQYDEHGNWLEESGNGFAGKCFRTNGKLRSCDQDDDQASFTYDTQGRVVEVAIGQAKVTYGYDHGDLVSIKDARHGDTTLAYDDHRLVSERTGRTTIRYRYDDAGHLVARGDGMVYGYDDHDRVVQVTKDRVTSTYAYDDRGRVASETTTSNSWGHHLEARREFGYCRAQ